jgi:putative ABC transport system substrate-binding protein
MKHVSVCLLMLLLFHALNAQLAAQQPNKSLPKIGLIFSFGTASDTPSPIYQAYIQGLRDFGYIEGKNITLERRYAEGRLDRMAPFVQEFVQKKVDAILGVNNVVIRAAKEATKSIPVIMISSVDPVTAGYVESFAHPGGNITGLAWLNRDISAKRIEILKELLPKISRIGVIWDADGPGPKVAFKEYAAAATAFKLDLRSLDVRGPTPDLAGALQGAKNANTDAVIVVGNPLMSQHMKTLFSLITTYRTPSMTEEDRYVEAGGLISYGANLSDLYRRAAEYTMEILKGAKPADLPVKLASKFDVFVNLKTAQEIGVVVPQRVLLQADRIIK